MRSRYLNRRMAAILFLGFSSGMPLALTGTTLQAWMTTEGVDLKLIGLFSLVGIPAAFKFLWSPLMDRFVPPFLGRRRGWCAITQLSLVLAIGAMAFTNPKAAPLATAVIAVLVAFFSASQDIVVDAYKTDVLAPEELGFGASLNIFGYRVAMIYSSALSLILADHLPWKYVYLIMAATMGIGLLTSFFSPEPEAPPKAPKTLREAVVLPFMEFFRRPAALEIVGFLILYKLDVVMAIAMTTTFLKGTLGFTLTEIATVTKIFGLGATLVGTLLGGAATMRLGIWRSLWIFGFTQGISNLTFMLLAHVGHNYPVMAASIILENLCSGMGNAAYAAFIMSLCDKRFTATQYALFSSLMALTRVLGGAPTGYLITSLGWEQFFLFCTLVAIPGLLLLTRYRRWELVGEAVPAVAGH